MFTIQAVSKIIGIPTRTIRTWEERYNAVSPQRMENGYRIYSEQDISDLQWLKEQVYKKGNSIKLAAEMLCRRKHERIFVGQDELILNLTHTLLELDSNKSNQLLDLYFSQFDYEYVFHYIITPALVSIGDKWEKGEISESEEHFASNLIIHRFYLFFRVFHVNPSLPKVLCFCPEGELHHIGLLLFTLFLRKHGVDTIYLGPNTPYNSGLKTIIKNKEIRWLAISVTSDTAINVFALVQEISRDFPAIKLVLGGQGFINAPESIRKWLIGDSKQEWLQWFDTQIKK